MSTIDFLLRLLGLSAKPGEQNNKTAQDAVAKPVVLPDKRQPIESPSNKKINEGKATAKLTKGIQDLKSTPEELKPKVKKEKKRERAEVLVGEFVHQERSSLTFQPGILSNTFIHLKGIGEKKESELWSGGVLTHGDAMKSSKLANRQDCIKTTMHALEKGDLQTFYEGMSAKDHWRLFGDLMGQTAYVDIETTGLGSSTDIITTTVVHSQKSTSVFVNGKNLDELVGHIKQFGLIVTYNGKSFDLPFIERFFKTKINTPHIDLRYVLAGMGYKGGLKSCEKQLKLPTRAGMEDIDGFTAVLLWNHYDRTKDPRALETLLAYNYEDTVRLEWLMIEAYNQKVSALPIKTRILEKPRLPANPYKSNQEILRRL